VNEDSEVIDAARALAAAGLVDAFGHVSIRRGESVMLTPARPLAQLSHSDALLPVALDVDELPTGVPKEAWIHLGVYRNRPDVTAICRAQPPSAAVCAASGVPIRPLYGHGAFLGSEVPVFQDARLVRTKQLGDAVAATLGQAPALVMRGTGAVAVADRPGRAMALMAVLERSARLNLEAAAVGRPALELSSAEFEGWQEVRSELLDRFWAYLRTQAPRSPLADATPELRLD